MKIKNATILGILIGAIAIVTSLADATPPVSDVIVLTSKNTVSLNGPVNATSSSEVIQKVQELNKKPQTVRGIVTANLPGVSKAPIYLFIHTPGGSIGNGLEIIEALKSSERRIDTISMFSASMGFQIVQSLGTRYILKSGTLMSHHASGGVQGEFGGKANNQLRTRLNYLEEMIKSMDLQTVSRTNGKQTLASYQEAYDHELWLHGDAAVAQGYADKVVSVRCDDSLAGFSTRIVTVNTFLGPLHLKYDIANCPLDSTPKNIRLAAGPATDAVVQLRFNAAVKSLLNGYTDLQNNVLPMSY